MVKIATRLSRARVAATSGTCISDDAATGTGSAAFKSA